MKNHTTEGDGIAALLGIASMNERARRDLMTPEDSLSAASALMASDPAIAAEFNNDAKVLASYLRAEASALPPAPPIPAPPPRAAPAPAPAPAATRPAPAPPPAAVATAPVTAPRAVATEPASMTDREIIVALGFYPDSVDLRHALNQRLIYPIREDGELSYRSSALGVIEDKVLARRVGAELQRRFQADLAAT